MVFSPRPRRRRIGRGGRDGVAIAAAGLVRPWSAAIFAAAAVPGSVAEDLAVTIPPELEVQILRYHHVEKWPVGTIAKQLRVHHTTVSRVLLQAGLPRILQHPKRSKADPFLPFIRATLESFPTLTASRLYAMVRERGYTGRPDHFRHIVACLRPRPAAEAYLRLRTLPGEQAQVDWGHFGHLTIGRARRPLMAFVMVLSYSRQIFLRFFLDARLTSFLRGHLAAFGEWLGVPRIILYDNLRSAVLERHGAAIRFHPTLLDFAGHHRYEPRPVAVARGNEKGRVERAIRYVRDNFFAARQFADLDDLNTRAQAWCHGPAADRRCPEDESVSVREAFAAEAARLLSLPDEPFPLVERVAVSVGKTPYVRRVLTVLAEPSRLRILDAQHVVASHARSYGKGEQIEDPAHLQALVAHKRAARQHRAGDRLTQAAPASQTLLIRAAERGDNLGAITALLLRLLDQYGAGELETAIGDALDRNVPHPNAVRLALERRRHNRQQAPPIAPPLPAHLRARDTVVKPHRLETYDQLMQAPHDDP